MASKRDIIKDLKQQIKDLEDKAKGQAQHINYREKQFLRVKRDHEAELSRINRYTNGVANTLKFKFNKELAWMALCDDPESKFQYIKRVVYDLEAIAAPPEEYHDVEK